MGDLVTSWEEILGSKDWTGLIEPELDRGLRQLIIRCADFCQATYDAFDSDAESPARGNTRHPNLDSFFSAVERLSDQSSGGLLYHALSFLYAASGTGDPSRNLFLLPSPAVREPWDRQSNWMGYVASTSDEASRALGRREIYVVWRGTIMGSEWTSNVAGVLQAAAGPLLNAGKVDNSVQVHRGWYNVYTSEDSKSTHATTSARAQVRSAVRGLLEKHSGENISVIVTGHSLGGALATLCAFDLVENADVGADVHVAAVVYGCPQVGNAAFKRRVEAHPNLNILHVSNDGDVVPQLPDSALPFYVPIVTADLEIQHPGSWYDVANNHSLIVTLDALRGNKFSNGLALQTLGSAMT